MELIFEWNDVFDIDVHPAVSAEEGLRIGPEVLLESPESIDFTSEVTATLEHRVFTHGGGLGGIVVPGTQVVLTPLHHAPLDIRAELTRAAAISASGGSPVPPAPAVRVTDVARHATGIDVELAIDGVRDRSLSAARIVFVEHAADAPGAQFRVYTGSLERTARGARVHARESDRVTVLRPYESVLTADLLDRLQPGGLAAVVSGIAELGGTVVIGGGSWHNEEVPVRIIQDGSARHALLVPMAAGGTPAGLNAGTYRMTLAIERARWATTAPADGTNRYQDSATVSFTL